jgi:hypothetical protein
VEEIVEAEKEILTNTPDINETDLILDTAMQLDRLKENLEDVGYYGRSVWAELLLNREILLRAINWKARLSNLKMNAYGQYY